MPVSLSTPDHPPEGEGVKWEVCQFHSLRAHVEKVLRAIAILKPRMGAPADSLLAAWWGPDGAKREDAQPIADAQREIVSAPAKDGVFYVRIFKKPVEGDRDEDDPAPEARYYQASGVLGAGAVTDPSFGAFVRSSAQANAELSNDLTLARERNRDLESTIDGLRRSLRDAEDERSRAERELKAATDENGRLTAQLAELEQPWIGESEFGALLPLLKQYVEYPGGTGEQHLTKVVDAFVGVVNQIASADFGVLARIAERTPEAWDTIARAVNGVLEAKSNPARVPMAKSLLQDYAEQPFRALGMYEAALAEAKLAVRERRATSVQKASLLSLPPVIEAMRRDLGLDEEEQGAVRRRPRLAAKPAPRRSIRSKPARATAAARMATSNKRGSTGRIQRPRKRAKK